MALTFTLSDQPVIEGPYKRIRGTIAWDSSYPTNGEDYATGLGTNVLNLECTPYAGYVFQTDYTNKKIKAFVPISVAGGAAAVGSDGLSLKAGGVDIEFAAARHSAGKEVPDTTNLSALTLAPFTALLRI